MRKTIMLATLLLPLLPLRAQNFGTYPVYTGTDLGLKYSPAQSTFRIWAPRADAAELVLYKEALGGNAIKTVKMTKGIQGTWLAKLQGDQQGKFYAFRVMRKGTWSNEVPDPYVKAVGVNGKRGCIVDLKKSNPDDWAKDISPRTASATDAIIYELHVRDASISFNSGIQNKGIFKGLTEAGTKNSAGQSTGLDHLKELGVTHIHLLPFYDYLSVDETKLDKPQYNWGYEPLNYNVPEGSYSSGPYDPLTRIRELKQMVQALHKNGLNVVMDVVYNHTMLTEDSWFNQLVPGYYYRQTEDGKFSNATACGNETASERPMMRKFMIESLEYWVKEYHIDGFRFDLMGVHDIATMNLIAKRLRKIKPDILLYGEGWTAGSSPLPDSVRALKKNASKLDGIAVFSDDVRDGIKGSVFVNEENGFASGRLNMESSIKFGVVASCEHPQVKYDEVNYSKAPYSVNPGSTVTYAECHDNHVLWDKLAISAPLATAEERKEMHKLALGIVLTSQGISFLHAGTEFLRSKGGNENSYNAGDSVNAIDWDLKTQHQDVVEYVRALIKLRKEHPAFRMKTGEQVREHLRFLDTPGGVVAYVIDANKVGDKWGKVMIIYNGGKAGVDLDVPPGRWTHLMLPGQEEVKVRDGKLGVKGYSMLVMVEE